MAHSIRDCWHIKNCGTSQPLNDKWLIRFNFAAQPQHKGVAKCMLAISAILSP